MDGGSWSGLCEQARAERRQADRDRLHDAARQLLSSEGWQRWVGVRSRHGLARLSLSNQLMVAIARPDATFVAGFRTWLKLGYHVRSGERAIRIIAPIPLKRADSARSEIDHGPVAFKTVSVFDRAQVDPLEGVVQAVLDPPCEPLTGDSHAHLLKPLGAFAHSLGFSVAFERVGGSGGGWCDPARRRIVVDAGLPGNRRVRVLVHELAHALGVGYREFGRERAEVIVDTVTHLVCSAVGLDVSGETVPYVAGWGEQGALEAVTGFAGAIDTLARRLERAVLGEDHGGQLEPGENPLPDDRPSA